MVLWFETSFSELLCWFFGNLPSSHTIWFSSPQLILCCVHTHKLWICIYFLFFTWLEFCSIHLWTIFLWYMQGLPCSSQLHLVKGGFFFPIIILISRLETLSLFVHVSQWACCGHCSPFKSCVLAMYQIILFWYLLDISY